MLYEILMTGLKKNRVKTATVKFVTREKCTLDYVNASNSAGILDPIQDVKFHEIEMEGSLLEITTIHLVWRAVIEASVETMQLDNSVEAVTANMANLFTKKPKASKSYAVPDAAMSTPGYN
jgi:hypothetical protein